MVAQMLLKRGAEAEIRAAEWHGRSVVVKSRLPKTYRHPNLDAALRANRIRTETRLLSEARHLGIPVPVMYDIDLGRGTMTLAHLQGPTLAELIGSGDDATQFCKALGAYMGKLHSAGIAHGDLTTSNMVITGGILHLLDFSLGERGADLEALGVDIHLLSESFNSAHAGRPELWRAFLSGYRSGNASADAVLGKAKEIEARGRYRGS